MRSDPNKLRKPDFFDFNRNPSGGAHEIKLWPTHEFTMFCEPGLLISGEWAYWHGMIPSVRYVLFCDGFDYHGGTPLEAIFDHQRERYAIAGFHLLMQAKEHDVKTAG